MKSISFCKKQEKCNFAKINHTIIIIMKSLRWYFYILLSFFCTGCIDKEDTEMVQLLYQYDSLSNTDPLYVQDRLKRLDNSGMSMFENNFYQLVYLKTIDKADSTDTALLAADSLLCSTYNYIDQKGSDYMKVEANYYMGRLQYEKSNWVEALRFYHKAIALSNASKVSIDNTLLARVHAQASFIYTTLEEYTDALKEMKDGFELLKNDSIEFVSCRTDLANCFYRAGMIDSADIMYTQALERIVMDKTQQKYLDHLYSMLIFYSAQKRREKTTQILNIIRSVPDKNMSCFMYESLGQAYDNCFGQVDSAIHYYRKALEKPDNSRDVMDMTLALAEMFNRKNNVDSLQYYFQKYYSVKYDLFSQGALDNFDKKDKISRLTRDKYVERQQAEDIKNLENWIIYTLIIASVISIVLICFVFIYRSRIKKQRKQWENERSVLTKELVDASKKIKEDRTKVYNLEINNKQLSQNLKKCRKAEILLTLQTLFVTDIKDFIDLCQQKSANNKILIDAEVVTLILLVIRDIKLSPEALERLITLKKAFITPILLRYIGLTYDDISILTNLAKSTVHNYIAQAKEVIPELGETASIQMKK